MVDVLKPATLRGFHVSVADIGDQMHLCHPLLSFEDDDALYLAHELDWQDDPESLAAADPEEAASHGTMLPMACSLPIASGQGVVAAGAAFVQAAGCASVQLESGIALTPIQDRLCWVGVATTGAYAALRDRLVEDAKEAFDRALAEAAEYEACLDDGGNAALLLLRRCGPMRRDDLAIRRLAGARQNREFDLYRRLLIRFAVELKTQESVLDERAGRHMALVAPQRDVDPARRKRGPMQRAETAASRPNKGDVATRATAMPK